MLSLKQGSELVKLARKAIEIVFKNKELDASYASLLKRYPEKQGVFVTLHTFLSNELRGCIGFIQPALPLGKAIIGAARAAAFSDPRFMPLTREELPNVKIEVSVLTEPELIKVKYPKEYLSKIEIGKDGLIIKSKSSSGLFLPQVWEQIPGKEEFLRNLCLKAGISPDAWKNDTSIKLYKFRVQIFSETKLRGEIIEKT